MKIIFQKLQIEKTSKQKEKAHYQKHNEINCDMKNGNW